MESYSDLDYEGSGLKLVHVSDVLDYLGEYTFPNVHLFKLLVGGGNITTRNLVTRLVTKC